MNIVDNLMAVERDLCGRVKLASTVYQERLVNGDEYDIQRAYNRYNKAMNNYSALTKFINKLEL